MVGNQTVKCHKVFRDKGKIMKKRKILFAFGFVVYKVHLLLVNRLDQNSF